MKIVISPGRFLKSFARREKKTNETLTVVKLLNTHTHTHRDNQSRVFLVGSSFIAMCLTRIVGLFTLTFAFAKN